MLLCAQGLLRTKPKTLRGLEPFLQFCLFLVRSRGFALRRATLSLSYSVSEKFLCPAQHTARQVFRLLPEACLLTGVLKKSFF